MKNILIVVDMQNDFVCGRLGTAEAEAIVPAVVSKIRQYASRGDLVIFTKDTHGEDYLSTPEGKKLPIRHCIIDTGGYSLHSDIERECSEIDRKNRKVLHKPTFGTLEWGQYITDGDNIELVGLCSDICVVSNALILKAMFPNCEISFDSSASAGTTPANHQAAIAILRACQVNITGEPILPSTPYDLR
jgi:nicotinamidase-related amidase